ncbi:hypothetical protein ACDA63_06980 [Uliginosibacterium sp. sgz301328]|uniref:hypothetical protein n=1 Tax=Uliginosibacterium sp. sgz301328 TaxID=3243764 RepID=UPI00359EB085
MYDGRLDGVEADDALRRHANATGARVFASAAALAGMSDLAICAVTAARIDTNRLLAYLGEKKS